MAALEVGAGRADLPAAAQKAGNGKSAGSAEFWIGIDLRGMPEEDGAAMTADDKVQQEPRKKTRNTPREPFCTPQDDHAKTTVVAQAPTPTGPSATSSVESPWPEDELWVAELTQPKFFEGDMADFDPPPLTAKVAVPSTPPPTKECTNHVMAMTPRDGAQQRSSTRGVVGLVPPR